MNTSTTIQTASDVPDQAAIANVHFKAEELAYVGEQVNSGDVTASLTVLAAFAEAIEAGHDSVNDAILGEFVCEAIGNVLGWYGDAQIGGNPIAHMQIAAQLEVITRKRTA